MLEPQGIYLDGAWISAEQAIKNLVGNWCYFCDRSRTDCACHLDPNGLPAGHWSKPHKHTYTSELGEQESGFGTLVCSCGMLQLYQVPGA